MIRSLVVVDPARACIEWWPKVAAFVGTERFDFGPGLNVVWGPNASGKTTLLRAMARMLCCEQGGEQKVTFEAWRRVSERLSHAPKLRDGLRLEHDGSPVAFFDPSDVPGLVDGAFDWDFGSMGVANAMAKGSAGQLVVHRGRALWSRLAGKEPWPEPEWKQVPRGTERGRLVETLLAPTVGVEPQRATALLDEPSRSLDVRVEDAMWTALEVHSERTQIVVATHSWRALFLPGASYVDVVPGYLEEARCRFLDRAVRAVRSELGAAIDFGAAAKARVDLEANP